MKQAIHTVNGVDFVEYDGHEWRAMLDGVSASKTHVACAECGMHAEIGKWPDKKCRVRLAPIEWLSVEEIRKIRLLPQ